MVVVREPLKPYEQAEWYVGLATLLVGVLVVLAVGAIARWVTSRALAPVAVMAEKAQDWSEHDLAGRFALGPPTNELAALGTTLDGLLDRVATTILAEQRLTSDSPTSCAPRWPPSRAPPTWRCSAAGCRKTPGSTSSRSPRRPG